MSQELVTVELEHPCGERRTLPVAAVTEKAVTIRWGLAGLDTLDLASNTLAARRPASSRPNFWRAADISALREAVRRHFDTGREARGEAVRRHAASMPQKRRMR